MYIVEHTIKYDDGDQSTSYVPCETLDDAISEIVNIDLGTYKIYKQV